MTTDDVMSHNRTKVPLEDLGGAAQAEEGAPGEAAAVSALDCDRTAMKPVGSVWRGEAVREAKTG